jgi:hypothetical protein
VMVKGPMFREKNVQSIILRTKGRVEVICRSNLVCVATDQIPYMTRESKPLLYFKYLLHSG